MEFAWIRIITSDVDRLTQFGESVTGAIVARPAPAFAEVPTGPSVLAIAIAIASTATVGMLGEHGRNPGSNTSVIIEFLVADVDAEFARLQDILQDVVFEPTTTPWGNRSTVFRDPDDNLFNSSTLQLFTRPTSRTPSGTVDESRDALLGTYLRRRSRLLLMRGSW